MPARNAGNEFSDIYGADANIRGRIRSLDVPVIAQVAASSTVLVGSFISPVQGGRPKGRIAGARWINGGVASVLGSGIVINILNVTNANKNCGAMTLAAGSIAAGSADSTGVAVLATTVTDRSAVTTSSPATTTTEPDVNFLAADQIQFQVVTQAGATLNPGHVQLDYQYIDAFTQ